jgi:uncharacterized protein with HEPN domain
MWRDDAYLLDILLAARKVVVFTQGVSWEQFESNELMQHGIMRLIQIIGEAARHLSPEFKQAHPDIPWTRIIGMRHHLVHEYFRIIPEEVWKVVQDDVPALIPLIEPLVPPDEPAGPGSA